MKLCLNSVFTNVPYTVQVSIFKHFCFSDQSTLFSQSKLVMSGAYLSFANFRLGTVRVIPLFCRQTDLLLSLAARTMIKLLFKNESYVEKREKKGRIFL